jgi:hypothetical protein
MPLDPMNPAAIRAPAEALAAALDVFGATNASAAAAGTWFTRPERS